MFLCSDKIYDPFIKTLWLIFCPLVIFDLHSVLKCLALLPESNLFCKSQIVIVNFRDKSCNEMQMDWPISIKMPCNHNLKENRTKLVSYILLNDHYSIDILAPGFFVHLETSFVYIAETKFQCSIKRCGSRFLPVTRGITTYFERPAK